MKNALSIQTLQEDASMFARIQSRIREKSLYGVTDGKALGTYVERKFKEYVAVNYSFEQSSSAAGIDFPSIDVDLKTTRISQPQSSCPFRSADQKIYGLGYNLLVFAYDKRDEDSEKSAYLEILHAIFVSKERTGDYQTTKGILELVGRDGNQDDLIAFFEERRLPIEEIQATQLAHRVLQRHPVQGYLTISNALQWRLQYSRVIQLAGSVEGVLRLR